MDISLASTNAEFRPWQPGFGRVFSSIFAFDSETTRIDEQHPWIATAFVLGAAFDGHRGFFLSREHAAEFFTVHANLPVVMHNAPFDLSVLAVLDPDLGIYNKVDQHLVWDTQLLHRLLALGTEGHTASGKGQSTLEHCARHYLEVELSKDLRDSTGDEVRLSYGKWLGKPSREIESVYLEYLGKDVLVTYMVFERLWSKMNELFATSKEVWGFVSQEWQVQQLHRWGFQTHHIQLKAAIVLKEITANGLHLDLERLAEVVRQLTEVAEERRISLRSLGYIPGQKGSEKALQEILRQLERVHPELTFPRTATGKFVTKRETLEDLADVEPFIKNLLEFNAVEKLLSSFLNKMGRRRIHPSFNAMLVTGRTSSFGELNAQNLPRDDRVRSCFVPSPGHVIIAADYAGLELATLSQSVIRQIGISSKMADAINAGQDLHRLVAAQLIGKPEAQVTSDERQKAKPINFGKPGGMGNDGLTRYAKASYGVVLNEAEVEALTSTWFSLFPEMRAFLESGRIWGEPVARFFELTPKSFYDHTGSRKFLDHRENYGRELVSHPILGSMCLKVLRELQPRTNKGVDYPVGEVDYFWAQVQQKVELLPVETHSAILSRQPSPSLGYAVQRLVERSSCMTLSGRIRARATYCAQHNTMFQGLAADGAKLALWGLWRAGYRIVNFIHDEVLIEVLSTSDLLNHAQTIERIMVSAMHEVVPDVRIDVEYAAMTRWQKGARAVLDVDRRLVPWVPPHEDTRTPIVNQ